MMLVLAVRTDAERVYERALRVLHARRDRRGVRRRPRRRQPDAAALGDEAGRARPARPVPGAGAGAPADLAAAVERRGGCSSPPARRCSSRSWRCRTCIGLFTPAELDDQLTRRPAAPSNADGPDGAVRPDRRPRCRASRPARRLDGRRRATCSNGAAQFWLDSDQAGEPRRARSTLLPPELVPGRRARPRCRATRSACAASSGPSSCRRTLRSDPHVRLRRAAASPTASTFDGDANAVADLRRSTPRSPSSPASRAGRDGRRAQRPVAVRRRRAAVPGR